MKYMKIELMHRVRKILETVEERIREWEDRAEETMQMQHKETEIGKKIRKAKEVVDRMRRCNV